VSSYIHSKVVKYEIVNGEKVESPWSNNSWVFRITKIAHSCNPWI